jgi:hypothetical protein
MSAIFYNDVLYASGGSAYGGINTPTSDIGSDGDFYYQFNELSEVAISYVKIGGTWHKIAGGDVIDGDVTSTNYGKYAMVGNHNIGMEVDFNAE